jgi:hypothetical protein
MLSRSARGVVVVLGVLVGSGCKVKCPDAGAAGACEGQVAAWCDDGASRATELDCAKLITGGTCTSLENFGAWCQAPATSPSCLVPDAGRAQALSCGDGNACDLELGCVADVGVCAPSNHVVTCRRNSLVTGCTPFGEPLIHSCTGAALGGTGCEDGQCQGVKRGAACDAQLECNPALSCTDAGVCGDFVPASHPPLLQVVSQGGPVLATPGVLMATWSNDPLRADYDGFLPELARTPYWGQVTAEYGVGPLAPPQHQVLGPTAPASLTDAQVRQLLHDHLSGPTPDWGAPDASTVYLVSVPETVSYDYGDGSRCCSAFGGYHGETSIDGVRVPYGIICECTYFFAGLSMAQNTTVVVSHELVEAATDPFPYTAPAFSVPDDAHLGWAIYVYGELGDVCTFAPGAVVVPDGGSSYVQRSFSNREAALGHDPCVPAQGPLTGAVPVLPDTATVTGYEGAPTQVVKIGVGQTRVIDVPVFSPVPGERVEVQADDATRGLQGGSALLTLVLDRQHAQNGDVPHLSITPNGFDPTTGVAGFTVTSTSKDGTHGLLSVGLVVPP